MIFVICVLYALILVLQNMVWYREWTRIYEILCSNCKGEIPKESKKTNKRTNVLKAGHKRALAKWRSGGINVDRSEDD